VEQANPPAPVPVEFKNGKTATGYGVESALVFRATNRWTLHLGYTEMRLNLDPKPGSADTSHTSGDAGDPDRWVLLRSVLDLRRGFTLDATARYVGPIQSLNVPAYGELDGRLAWSPVPALRLSVIGQNLLHDHHAEFGGPVARLIERNVFAQVEFTH
jgi:iron complex outermembrane receptor protein